MTGGATQTVNGDDAPEAGDDSCEHGNIFAGIATGLLQPAQ